MIDLEYVRQCAVVRFNRPEALNAINAAAFERFDDVLSELELGGSRAMILTGAGDRAFCAGADIGELGSRNAAEVHAAARRGQALSRRIERLPMPSIALINGYALGGGLELALGCTFRLATMNARMGFPEIRLGVCTGWGGTQRLPRLIRTQDALDLLMSGRMVAADEAKDLGLIHSVVDGDPLESALAFAGRFTEHSLAALRYVKEAVSRARDLPLHEGLKAEADLSALSYQTEDAREGIAAFVEKRKPHFQDR